MNRVLRNNAEVMSRHLCTAAHPASGLYCLRTLLSASPGAFHLGHANEQPARRVTEKSETNKNKGCGCRTNTTRTQQRTPTPRLKREHAKKTHTCSHRRTGKSAVLHRIRFLGQGKRGTKSPLRFVRDLNPGPLHPKRESHPGTNAPTFGHS